MRKSDIFDLIDKVDQKDKEASGVAFIAPLTRGSKVRILVDGLRVEMKAPQVTQDQWAILERTGLNHCKITGNPTAKQIRAYMELLPRLQVIILDYFDGQRYGLQLSTGSKGLMIDGIFPLRLCDRGRPLDVISCRFDGKNIWYETTGSRDPAISRQMRDWLEANVDPKDVRVRGATERDMLAYKTLHLARNPVNEFVAQKKDDDRTRLSKALHLAGANLDSFTMAGDQMRVNFVYDGRRHTASIRSDNFQVVTAGLCLAGQDAKFDLTSLVGVLREKDSGRGRSAYDNDGYDD